MKINSSPALPHIKASEGRAFRFGDTSVYVGPREPSPNGRNLKRPPVLAYSRVGVDLTPHIVAEFPNSTAAEEFMQALTLGIDEAALASANAQRPDLAPAAPGEPQCGDVHNVETPFGIVRSTCERPPHETGDHAGPLVDDRLPAGFPKRANWVATPPAPQYESGLSIVWAVGDRISPRYDDGVGIVAELREPREVDGATRPVLGVRWITDVHDDTPDDEIPITETLDDGTYLRWPAVTA